MAPPKIMRALTEVVDKLDIRRAQVLVEAVIVEVNADKTSESGGELGGVVQRIEWNPDSGGCVHRADRRLFTRRCRQYCPRHCERHVQLGQLPDRHDARARENIGQRHQFWRNAARDEWRRQYQCRGDSVGDHNGQSGSRAEGCAGSALHYRAVRNNIRVYDQHSSTVSPFTTVQRQEVGTILKVTPQIATGSDSVILKISIESSSVAATSVSSVDITTNKRTVSTSVLIEDGGIVVLGGLISDNVTRVSSGYRFSAAFLSSVFSSKHVITPGPGTI